MRAESVGGDDVRSGADIVDVNSAHDIGRLDERIGRPQWQAGIDAAPGQFRAGRAVEDQQCAGSEASGEVVSVHTPDYNLFLAEARLMREMAQAAFHQAERSKV